MEKAWFRILIKIRILFVIVLGMASIVGCGGGGGGSGSSNPDTTRPTVSSTTPTSGSTDVAQNSKVSAKLSESIQASSINSSSFTLFSTSGRFVAAIVSYDNDTNTATLEPSQGLDLLTSYTAILSSAVTDLAGNKLVNDHRWSFTTEDSQWGSAELIENDNSGVASFPQVVLDPDGNAIAVWQQSDGTRENIWANRYTVGIGWGMPELIENDDVGDAGNVEVAIDSNGNAIAGWHQSDGTRNNLWTNRFTAGVGWGTPELLETDNAGDAGRGGVVSRAVSLAIDASGNAFAVWTQSDGIKFIVWANRYIFGVGWGSAELLKIADPSSGITPQVAVDASGNAFSVWVQTTAIGGNIWANRYTLGAGWGTAELVEFDNAGGASNPHIMFDPNGDAVVVWGQSDGIRRNIMANRYSGSTGWGVPELIETDNTGNASRPRIAIDGNGNALVVWSQTYGFVHSDIWSNRYTAGVGWEIAQLIETDDIFSARRPRISFDVKGNALAVWSQDSQILSKVASNHYSAGIGWGIADVIDADNTDNASYPDFAVNASGNAIAVWSVGNSVSSGDIWASTLDLEK